MLLAFACSVWKGYGWSNSREICERRFFASNPHGWFPSTRRNDGHLAASPSDGQQVDEILDEISWLSVEGSQRLAYRHVPRSDAASILFCNGFRSDMTGTKVAALENHCIQRNWEFCAFDYSGHGLSSGTFEDCTLSDWIRDASTILDKVLLSDGQSNKPVIVVGSSMGAWIAIHLALQYNNKNNLPVAGILGIASGPDFLQDMYSSSTPKQQEEWRSKGMVHLPSRYEDPYPISWNLIRDAAEQWGILPSTKPIPGVQYKSAGKLPSCQVRLLHGTCDQDVSWKKSKELADLWNAADDHDALLTLIDDGDHRLSRPQDITLLLETLDGMVSSLEDNQE